MIDASDEIDDNFSDGEGHGTEIRRARLVFSGTVYERLIFKTEYDFANTGDGEVDLKDAYIGLTGLGPLGTVIVGHFKEPLSLEEQNSSNFIMFMEKGLPGAFVPGRNTGFMASNAVVDRRLLWQVAATEEANDSGFSFDDESR